MPTPEQSTVRERAEGRCPVIAVDYTATRPAFWHFEHLDALREEAPFAVDTVPRPFWMFNRYDQVREALQNPDVFTNDVLSALSDPETQTRLLPQTLSGLEHVRYRQILNPWFSPSSVARIEPFARQRCREMVVDLAPRGACDLAVDFAMVYPTEVFLAMLGLPTEDGARLLPLVEGMFRGFFGGDPDAMAVVLAEIEDYYESIVADREATPRDVREDFVSWLLQAKVGDVPLPRRDVVTVCLTIMAAGLDTTRSALGYIFHHLATHADHRQRLLDDPSLIPEAVEELLRLYGLLIQDGRYVAEDIEFHGCPLKKGDVIWLGLAAASRDPRRFDRPDEFVLGRDFTKHLGFGAGAHRCLGSHLARAELVIVLEEWLAQIPHFELAATGPLTERGGQLMLLSVPLRWEV